MSLFEQKLSLLTLGVSSLSISRDFYTNTFGWQEHPMSNAKVVFYYLQAGALGLYALEDLQQDAGVKIQAPSGYRPVTLAINQASEKEVDERISKLRGLGVAIVKEPVRAAWGGYHAYIADPDNYLWEVAFNPFDKAL